MRKTNWLTHASKAVLVAAALLMSGGPNTAHAEAKFGVATPMIAVGWNLIRVQVCIAGQANGVDYIVIVSTTGDQLVSTDPIVIADGAQFCANGNAFYVFTPDGFTVQQYAFYPGLK